MAYRPSGRLYEKESTLEFIADRHQVALYRLIGHLADTIFIIILSTGKDLPYPYINSD